MATQRSSSQVQWCREPDRRHHMQTGQRQKHPPQKKDLMHTTYVNRTSDKIADISRKRTTKPHGQGCGVPDPLCTVQWSLHWWNRKTLEDQDRWTQKSSGHRCCTECQCYPLDEDKPQHGLGGSTHGGQVKQVEEEEDQGEHVHQDQENVHGFRVFAESSLELPN